MGFKKLLFGMAKDMDKQRLKEMDKRAKLQQKEQERQLKVETLKSHLDAILTPYNVWVDEFSLLEEQYQNFDVTAENVDEFLEIHDKVIEGAKQMIKKLELLPQPYDLPKATQQYVKDMREDFIQSLNHRVMYSLKIKAGLLEVLEFGQSVNHPPEATHVHLEEAIAFGDAAEANMNRAIQTVQ